MVESDLELVDVGFELLLHAKSLGLALGLSLKGSLHGVKSALVALAGVFELLFLLLDSPVNLLPDLAKLKLTTEELVLFLLKSSLSLFKSGLELFLLHLKALSILLNLVEG